MDGSSFVDHLLRQTFGRGCWSPGALVGVTGNRRMRPATSLVGGRLASGNAVKPSRPRLLAGSPGRLSAAARLTARGLDGTDETSSNWRAVNDHRLIPPLTPEFAHAPQPRSDGIVYRSATRAAERRSGNRRARRRQRRDTRLEPRDGGDDSHGRRATTSPGRAAAAADRVRQIDRAGLPRQLRSPHRVPTQPGVTESVSGMSPCLRARSVPRSDDPLTRGNPPAEPRDRRTSAFHLGPGRAIVAALPSRSRRANSATPESSNHALRTPSFAAGQLILLYRRQRRRMTSSTLRLETVGATNRASLEMFRRRNVQDSPGWSAAGRERR